MSKKRNLFDIILNIIIVILSALVIYWLIQLIFGGSPSLSEFNFSMIILMVGFLFKIYREMGEMKIDSRYMSKGVKEGFKNIKDDISHIKSDMNLIKKKLKV